MKNKKMKPVFFITILMICLKINAQSSSDNLDKVLKTNKTSITRGAVHISRASSDSEKVYLPIQKGEGIPNKVWELSNVKVLNIGMPYNGSCPVVGEIPNALNTLKKLEYVYFDGIGVKSLPSDLDSLTNLKSIYISEAKSVEVELEQLTDFGKLPSLQIIHIDLNAKKDITLVDNFFTIFDKTELKVLVLNNSKLKSDVFQHGNGFTQLEILKLSGNELQEIPSIYKNRQLKQLDIGSNELISVDKNIGLLQELEILDLGYNNLTELPSEIGNLSKLRILKLNHNQLERLPTSLQNLSELESLILRGNNLTEIPEFVFHLKNLKELDLISTRISSIDERILNTNLEAISISHQDVGGFSFDPNMISQLKSLKTFQVSSLKAEKEVFKSKNKLKKIRPDIY